MTNFFVSDPVRSETDAPTLRARRGDPSGTTGFKKTGIFTVTLDPVSRPGHGTADPLGVPFQQQRSVPPPAQETVSAS